MADKVLKVEEDAMEFALAVYELTDLLPKEEKFGLSDQMRRAAVSVPSNLAEGRGRGSKKDFAHFCKIADGSLQELKVQVTIAVRRGYVSREQAAKVYRHAEQVGRQIGGLIRYLSGNKSAKSEEVSDFDD